MNRQLACEAGGMLVAPGVSPGVEPDNRFQRAPQGAKEICRSGSEVLSAARFAGLYVWVLPDPGLTPGATNMPSAHADSSRFLPPPDLNQGSKKEWKSLIPISFMATDPILSG